ncbi:MAG: hypothetical protein A2X49_01535 [Lentisphaerae bacterium GWF2_52_8]|nr:MAG: hypothetical protein A2X49_01535 [Lentisphaerae bacterium GWF2_52_8]
MQTLKLPVFDSAIKDQGPNASLLFGGDFCPIARYEEKILGHEAIFDEALSGTFRQNDFAMINLEAPLCAPGLQSESPGGGGLRADPAIAAFIRGIGIDAVGLSNNHIRDFRDEGVLQTMRNLEKNEVLHTGAGMNLNEAQKPLSVNVNGLKVGIWALAEKELNVAAEDSAGSSWFRPDEDVRRIAELKGEFDFLLVFLHAGHEFTTAPSPRIRKTYRSLIDAGADAVIGHHPHVIQGIERYRHGLIAYSLGNLVFDSPYVDAYKNTDLGYLIRIGISKHQINEVELIPYKLRSSILVSSLTRQEFEEFSARFQELSENITDDQKFRQEWENNVRFRWDGEFKRVLSNLSKNFNDIENKDYARRTRNLFTCPTHVEMLEKAFLMLEEGKLSRDQHKS